MSESDLPLPEPIVCTLSQAELATRRTELLPGLLSKADSQETIPGGFRWGFRETNGLLIELVVSHRCRAALLQVLALPSHV